ncbi:hypothetical protein AAHZ94_33355, partial [Streptomyces sp. HSW2009]
MSAAGSTGPGKATGSAEHGNGAGGTSAGPAPAPDPAGPPPGGLRRFSLNQQTVRQWSLPELVDGCAFAGVPSVGLWREPVQAYGPARAARLVRAAGLTVSSLCRGGFLTAADPGARTAALVDNRRAIDEAAALGTATLVLVSGGGAAGRPGRLGGRARGGAPGAAHAPDPPPPPGGGGRAARARRVLAGRGAGVRGHRPAAVPRRLVR